MTAVKIATCMPPQRYDRQSKYSWMQTAVANTDCDLFLLPQEYFGGLYIMPDDMHIERDWLFENVGAVARRTGKAIGVGACIKLDHFRERSEEARDSLAVEEYVYFAKSGEPVGRHRKIGLPSYDDVNKQGAGQLVAETAVGARLQPVELLGLRIGTVFCWEVFSLGLFAGYARHDTTLIVHPIKFAPAAWPVLSKNKGRGERRTIAGFEQDPTNMLWLDKLYMASKHEVMCPIAVTCNSWALGPRFTTLVGMIDGLRMGRGQLSSVVCEKDREHIETFTMDPAVYQAVFDGKLTDVVSDPETLKHLRHWTMHRKMRRLGL